MTNIIKFSSCLTTVSAIALVLGAACADDPADDSVTTPTAGSGGSSPDGTDGGSGGGSAGETSGGTTGGATSDGGTAGTTGDGTAGTTGDGTTGDPPETACTTWERHTGVPGSDWYDMAWLDADRAFIVGLAGSVIRTEDGGESWTLVDVGTGDDLRTVSFAPGVDADHGWIVGGGAVDDTLSKSTTIRHTEDGGDTWTGQSTGISFPPTRVHAVDRDTAWTVWGLGKFHPDGHWNRTSDGGDEWTTPPGVFLRPGRALMDVHFVDGQTGWASGSNTYVTFILDGEEQITPLAGPGKIGGIVRTLDGGDSWVLQKTDAPEAVYFMGVYFVDATTGWAVHDAGGIYGTTNGGDTWTGQVSGVSSSLRAVRFRDGSTGWVVGDGGVILHTDDGSTWAPQDSGVSSTLRRLAAPAGGNPWAVGDDGVVLRCVAE